MTNQKYESLFIEPEASEDVGMYGESWLDFMQEHHPELVKQLKANKTLLAVAQSVDDTAWNYRELLDRQYMELHPRPEVSFEKIAAWEKTRAFYTDGEVMRSKVLIPRTVP
jgi:hypothetical protein